MYKSKSVYLWNITALRCLPVSYTHDRSPSFVQDLLLLYGPMTPIPSYYSSCIPIPNVVLQLGNGVRFCDKNITLEVVPQPAITRILFLTTIRASNRASLAISLRLPLLASYLHY